MSSNGSDREKDGSRRGSEPLPVRSVLSGKIASQYAHDSRHHEQLAVLSLREQLDLLGQVEDESLRTELKHQNKVARSAVRALGEMVEDMVLYIRLGAGVPNPVARQGLMIGPVMMRIEEARGPVAQEKGIELKVMPSRMAVITDHRILWRLLCNLIDNAIHHSNGTRIVVGMRLHGDQCMLEVADNGRGIAEAEQERIFEAGYRGVGAGGENWSEGRGLGLYIVKSLAEQIDGRVEVKSAPGRGARFRVLIDSPVEWQPRGINPTKSEKTSLDGRTIAVLEDHIETLKLYESAFSARGATVIASDNPTEWVSKVASAKRLPDLFIVDFMIGRGTSDLALQMLRSRLRDVVPKGGKKGGKGVLGLPIVIVTGNPGHPQLRELAKNTPVLQKPLNEQSIETLTQVAAGKRTLNASDFIN